MQFMSRTHTFHAVDCVSNAQILNLRPSDRIHPDFDGSVSSDSYKVNFLSVFYHSNVTILPLALFIWLIFTFPIPSQTANNIARSVVGF